MASIGHIGWMCGRCNSTPLQVRSTSVLRGGQSGHKRQWAGGLGRLGIAWIWVVVTLLYDMNHWSLASLSWQRMPRLAMIF
jgi:hypothetical protein